MTRCVNRHPPSTLPTRIARCCSSKVRQPTIDAPFSQPCLGIQMPGLRSSAPPNATVGMVHRHLDIWIAPRLARSRRLSEVTPRGRNIAARILSDNHLTPMAALSGASPLALARLRGRHCAGRSISPFVGGLLLSQPSLSPTKNDIPEQRKPTPQPDPLGNTHQFYRLQKILAAQALDDKAASSVSRGYSVNTRAELGARPYPD